MNNVYGGIVMSNKVDENNCDIPIGELRRDLITGKWVVIAPARGKRPRDFARPKKDDGLEIKYRKDCPFCNLVTYPQEPDVIRLPDSDDWRVHIFGNKFPAFVARDEPRSWQKGPYQVMDAVGHHEVVAMRWHDQHESVISIRDFEILIEALVMRYRQLADKPSVRYIQIIKNYGPEGGASLEHPHHQIFTTPVLPSDVLDVFNGAASFAENNQRNAFSTILDYERESGERIVYENEGFIAFCPFASRVPFEVWILPLEHEPSFGEIGPHERFCFADAIQKVVQKISRVLNNPSYNYYIHSAPCDVTGLVSDLTSFSAFRWHLEFLPHLNIWGGFELGTGLEINPVVPEEAASLLRDA